MQRNAHVFPCPLEVTLEPPTHSKDTVLLLWQLLDTMCRVTSCLGGASAVIWKFKPFLYWPVPSAWTASRPMHANPQDFLPFLSFLPLSECRFWWCWSTQACAFCNSWNDPPPNLPMCATEEHVVLSEVYLSTTRNKIQAQLSHRMKWKFQEWVELSVTIWEVTAYNFRTIEVK